eukprot:GEMP01052965.1.p1 GENE.GEMP01052965.1~~GEMP01052965.1.p1  ORF type:complete len:381 (+),score=70.91 GEMP01052965.1:74-1216(+)
MSVSKPVFTRLTDLASELLGSKVLFATDQWFAEASNLLKSEEPVWKEGVFTEHGKWMDGWESRRKRSKGHDWCVIELGKPGQIRGVLLDTAFFTGNNVPTASIQGACIAHPLTLEGPQGPGTKATQEQIDAAEDKLAKENWLDILPQSALGPGYPETRMNYFEVKCEDTVTHLRLNYFPDGGVARFRAFGEISNVIDEGDFAFCANGGIALAASNEHYGTPANLFLPGRAPNMGNGWETARHPNRPPIIRVDPDTKMLDFGLGRDWFVLRLGRRCSVNKVLVDTLHFKGNYPESILIEGIDDIEFFKQPVLEQIRKIKDKTFRESLPWKRVNPIVPRTLLAPNKEHAFDVPQSGAVTHLMVTIFPDGGISRLRIHGRAKL